MNVYVNDYKYDVYMWWVVFEVFVCLSNWYDSISVSIK